MIMFFAIVGMVVVGLTAVTTAAGLTVMGLVAITERRAPGDRTRLWRPRGS
jgi:hypothetical protein